jgi:lysophospholipase L1-like esterase
MRSALLSVEHRPQEADMAAPTIEQPGAERPAAGSPAPSRHWIRVAAVCFVLGVGLPAALMYLTDVGAHSRVFVVAFGVLLVPGVLVLDQWRAHRGKVVLGIVVGAVLAGVAIASLGGATSWAIPKARWAIEHRILAAALLGAAVLVAVAGLGVLTVMRWPDRTDRRSTLIALGLGAVGGVALTGVLVVGLTWQGRYRYSDDVAVPELHNHVGRYVALGDSYSAGEGLGPFFTVDGCHRSTQFSYTELLRHDGQPILRTSDFRACSGARTRQIYDFAQNTALGTQVQAGLLGPDTGLITLTMGGNDLHFSDVLFFCFEQSNCMDQTFSVAGPAPDEAADIVRAEPLRQWGTDMLKVIDDRLSAVLTRLHADAPNARIIVIGYPHLLPVGRLPRQFNVCDAALAAFDRGERQGLAEMQDRFNATTKATATANHADFIDPSAAFESHEVCGLRGELIHSTNLSTRDPGMFHPTAKGQRLLAREIVCHVNADC